MKLYQCHKQVCGIKIEKVVPLNPEHGAAALIGFSGKVVHVGPELVSVFHPQAGQYYLIDNEGHESLLPAKVFEEEYREIPDHPITLGEPGTEQFNVQVHVDDILIHTQPIHDPFVTQSVFFKGWELLKAWLLRRQIRVDVNVCGTPAAERRILAMDPVEMQRENMEYAAKLSAGCAQLEAAAQASMQKAKL